MTLYLKICSEFPIFTILHDANKFEIRYFREAGLVANQIIFKYPSIQPQIYTICAENFTVLQKPKKTFLFPYTEIQTDDSCNRGCAPASRT